MTRKSTPSNMRLNCDRRMRAYIVAPGRCERCGTSSGPFECAHIIRRRYSWTRSDERNAWCLCRPCHEMVDTHFTDFQSLIEDTIGWELFVELEEKSKRRDKFDWALELNRWKALA